MRATLARNRIRYAGDVAIVVVVLAFVLVWASPAWAATFTVDRTDDPTVRNSNTCTPAARDCSLRQAVFDANAPGPDTISLAATEYVLSIKGAGEDLSKTGDLDIADDSTINGSGAGGTSVISGGMGDRVFHVLSGADAKITNLTVSGGSPPQSPSFLLGGGILNSGAVTLNAAEVSSNVAGRGSAAVGGGIYNDRGTLTLSDSTVKSNLAGGKGGGIYNAGGTLTVTGSTVSSNEGSVVGGGIVSDTNLSGATTTITNSTISGNTANALGGGVFNAGGLTEIENTTVTNNSAPSGKGAGAASKGTSATITEVSSSIISANRGTDVDVVDGQTATFRTRGYNLIGNGNAAGSFDESGDKPGVVDPGLDPLADYGGPTETHRLQQDSPALNAGPPVEADPEGRKCPPPVTDQRGVGRPQGAVCDTGSFELQAQIGGAPKPACNDAVDNDGDGKVDLEDPGCSSERDDSERDRPRCTIVGTKENDVLLGTRRRDVICARGGNDVVKAGGGDDIVRGSGGNDAILGGDGDDTLYGGKGADALLGGAGEDQLVGGPGKDRIRQ